MEIVIITGMSGAGKTEALKCLEDMGYYAIDNIPASLLANIVDVASSEGKKLEKVAAVIDVRSGPSFGELYEALDALGEKNVPYAIIFVDATDDVLVRRFSQSRRIHPLDTEGLRVIDNIARERALLGGVRERADILIDTSDINIYEFRGKLLEMVPGTASLLTTKLTFISFGYKFGHPLDADIIFDLRFLPNPYWEPELRDLTGQDRPVAAYVLERDITVEFLEKFSLLIDLLIPGYVKERRVNLTIGLGCTGGRHRSVAIAEELARRFFASGHPVSVLHRDIEK
ncbi:MAG: RNase adapter RapZ [Actinobacteria bacterium]|nr:RNase adapter RapZ [Actinomycetota bacterium]MBU1944693.1 RNase adapter RapZ [Actinomycetota bacterium]MBU2689241.1 RNase adapter RapZ [Actinomycetota bacterium]